MQNTTIVETHGLSKRFGSGTLAVDGVDMSVRRGEVYGFLGPNGAGKTTTLKMLVGLIGTTSGTATVAGHAPGDPAGLAKIGSLIEGAAFYPYLSGRENLRLVADLASVSQRRVEEVLDLIEMTSRAGRKFGTYSTGMKMRIGVAAALLKDPSYRRETDGLIASDGLPLITLARYLNRPAAIRRSATMALSADPVAVTVAVKRPDRHAQRELS
jgi:ABC-type multidrug transport system ATPase subunit